MGIMSLLTGIPTEVITGTITMIGTYFMERESRKLDSDERRHEMEMERLKLEMMLQDKAKKRSPAWLRATLALIVITPVFGGMLYFGGKAGVSIDYVYEVPQKTLLGLIKWGRTIRVESLNGFPIMPFVTHSISQVLGFTFGRIAGRRN